MASTYSELKIELIGTGDQTGAWGATTNTNLGTAIQEAITGSADVSFSSSDVTVTLTDTNATQSARNLRLNLTGTSGGARNLILGSGCQIEKLYLVNNNLADAVTVKNTTGIGIDVPAGKSMWVFNNGIDVVDVVTHVTSLTTSTVNKVTITAPATSATLTVADGKTLTASNTLALAGTDSTTMTFPDTSASIGYLNVPVNSQSTNYTAVLTDSGKTIFHPSSDNNARTFTIPANSSVAYPLGTVLSFCNLAAANVTIAITSDTLYWTTAGVTGSRTLGQYGLATAVKLETTTWLISGSNLT